MEIPQGYRLLSQGEVSRKGDKYLSFDGNWQESNMSGFSVPGGLYIRPIDLEWHKNSGRCPVSPNQRVEVKLRNGKHSGMIPANSVRWNFLNDEFDIEEYQCVIGEPESPAPEKTVDVQYIKTQTVEVKLAGGIACTVEKDGETLYIYDKDNDVISIPSAIADNLIDSINLLR